MINFNLLPWQLTEIKVEVLKLKLSTRINKKLKILKILNNKMSKNDESTYQLQLKQKLKKVNSKY